jgi:hypothetical protein
VATRIVIATVLAACAVVPGAAQAVITGQPDDQGRTITFDVRAPGADVAGYARVLRTAVHGDEIDDVIVRVVPARAIRSRCRDSRAVGCYSRGPRGSVITIPARPARDVQATLLHEYGHHIDSMVRTPRWWSARRIAWRLRSGQVATDYSKGWSRSVGEVFAEDYVALHIRSVSAIRWLPQPSASVLRALRRDITSPRGEPQPVPSAPGAAPVDPASPAGPAPRYP